MLGKKHRGIERVDMTCHLGELTLKNPVLTAAGTAGHADELSTYFDISLLGAIVTKSVAIFATPGNKAPRLVPLSVGMLNSVGLQGTGIDAWIADDLPSLKRSGAQVICSIWGRTIQDFAQAAEKLTEVQKDITAVEVNVSCPNVEDFDKLFSYSPEKTKEVILSVKDCKIPCFVKLSPGGGELLNVAEAALENGAAGIVLVNTIPAMAIDIYGRKPKLGNVTGGLSGRALHPIALKAVYDCRRAFKEAAIIGVGGIATGEEALAMIMAGADAIEVGTATFADPRAPLKVLKGMEKFCRKNSVNKVSDLVGIAQGMP